jgi:hypothetical protein
MDPEAPRRKGVGSLELIAKLCAMRAKRCCLCWPKLSSAEQTYRFDRNVFPYYANYQPGWMSPAMVVNRREGRASISITAQRNPHLGRISVVCHFQIVLAQNAGRSCMLSEVISIRGLLRAQIGNTKPRCDEVMSLCDLVI